MSFTAVGDLTLFGSAVTAGTYTFTGAAIPAGSLVVIGWDGNVDSLTVTASDNSTQPGDPNVWLSAGTMSGGTFTAGVHYCLRITRPLLTTDTLTLTLGGAVTASRRSACGCIYTPSNGNAQLDKYQQVANDTTSPVGPTASTGTLSTAVDLAITFGFVKNGAVATGSANASTNMNSPGTHVEANSGGATTIVASRMADCNQAATTAMTGSWTYTGITTGACAIMAFMDVLQTWSPDTGRDRASSSDNPENYAPPPSQTMGIFSGNGAAAPDATAFMAASRANGFGRSAYSAVSNAADEPIPSASGWFQAAQRPREQPFYKPRSFVVPVYDQAATGPPDYSPGTILGRQTLSYVSPRSLSLIVAAPDIYAPAVARRQNGQGATIPRSSSIPAYDNQAAAAPDSWAQVLSSRMPPRNGSPKSLTIPAYDNPAVAADSWAQVIASRPSLLGPLERSSTIAAYLSAAAAPDVWVQGLASRIVAPYVGSFSAFMGAADEPVAADATWTPGLILARKVPYYLPPLARVVSPLVFQAPAAPDAYTPGVIQSRRVAPYAPPRGFLVLGLDDHACTTLLPDTLLGPDTILFPDLCPQTELGIVVVSRRLEARATRSFVVAAYDSPAAPAYTPGVIRSWPLPLLERKLSVTRSPLGIAVVSDAYVGVTQSAPREALGAPSSTTILPDLLPDAYVSLARSSGSFEQVARESLTIMPRGALVVITQAYVAPVQSRAVANYAAPRARAITALSPSPADQVVNSGGGGEWVIWGKPDFPGNRPGAWPRFPRPGFKRPSRYEKRGY